MRWKKMAGGLVIPVIPFSKQLDDHLRSPEGRKHRQQLAKEFVPLEDREGGFVTVEELARYTGLSEKTVWREIDAKALVVHRVRGRVIIANSDALSWLSARRED